MTSIVRIVRTTFGQNRWGFIEDTIKTILVCFSQFTVYIQEKWQAVQCILDCKLESDVIIK